MEVAKPLRDHTSAIVKSFESRKPLAASRPLRSLVLFHEDAGGFGAHDAGVGEFAARQLRPQIRTADVYRLPPLRSVLLDEPYLAQFRVIGREADLHRLDQQFALQF